MCKVVRRIGRTRLSAAVVTAVAASGAVAGAAVAQTTSTTTIESVSTAGAQGPGASGPGNITPDGRFIAFFSASPLAPNDTDSPITPFFDVYLRDLQPPRTTTLVSVSSNGTKGNRGSAQPFVSDNGRYVVFASESTNLVPGDPGFVPQQVYLRDMQTGTTERVSANDAGERANGFSDAGNVSADGRFVVFTSNASNLVPRDTNQAGDVFVRDRQTGTTRRVSVNSQGRQGDGPLGSLSPEISSDGRYVVFASGSTNLVKRDANGSVQDIFIHDLQTGTTELVSRSSAGIQGTSSSQTPAVTPGGRFVAFTSFSPNLVEGDTNGSFDVFVRDRQTGQTERVSVNSEVVQGQTPPGSPFPADSANPDISPDGNFVSFQSQASNLVPDDTNSSGFNDVFLRDRAAGTTIRANLSTTGEQTQNGTSNNSTVSANGHRVLFLSEATNLVTPDINGQRADVFLRDLGAPVPSSR